MKSKKLLSFGIMLFSITISSYASTYGFTSIYPGFWKWTCSVIFTAINIAIPWLIIIEAKEGYENSVEFIANDCWWTGFICSFFTILSYWIFPTTFCSLFGMICGMLVAAFFIVNRRQKKISWFYFVLLLVGLIPVACLLPEEWWGWKYFALCIVIGCESIFSGFIIKVEREKKVQIKEKTAVGKATREKSFVYSSLVFNYFFSILLLIGCLASWYKFFCIVFSSVLLVIFLCLLIYFLACIKIIKNQKLKKYKKIFGKTPSKIKELSKGVLYITTDYSTKSALKKMKKRLANALRLYEWGNNVYSIDELEKFYREQSYVECCEIKGSESKEKYKDFCSIADTLAKKLGYSKRKENFDDDSNDDKKNDDIDDINDNDIDDENENTKKTESLKALMKQLEDLIGLEQAKKEIKTVIEMKEVNKERKKNNLPPSEVSLHLIFSGNPGTGKTTVARLLGKIYKKLGILSKGDFFEVKREDLVDRYIGGSENNTKEKCREARGGVLFIDEAYSLASENDSRDFGQRVIEVLLSEMENSRDDFMVIAAGYPDKMDKFLNSNPGIKSRFGNTIHFEDYNGDELYEIFMSMCEKERYIIEDSLFAALRKYFDDLYKNRDNNFGNARTVRNYLDDCKKRQASRLSSTSKGKREKKDLQIFTKEDLGLK